MSIDFGPIPSPTSPIQEYFERKYRTPSANTSPAIPLSPQVERGIEEQLTTALNELAKKQATTCEKAITNKKTEDGAAPDPMPQRKVSIGSSTGYTAPAVAGHLKRRSLLGGSSTSQASSRRPSR